VLQHSIKLDEAKMSLKSGEVWSAIDEEDEVHGDDFEPLDQFPLSRVESRDKQWIGNTMHRHDEGMWGCPRPRANDDVHGKPAAEHHRTATTTVRATRL
jgi:hypothetical protein